MLNRIMAALALALALTAGWRSAANTETATRASPPAAAVCGRVTVGDGAGLYYQSIGDGPQIVVVPVGFYLEELLAPLAGDGRRLLFYDPRCRGRSDCPSLESVSLERQLQDLEDLRRELGIERMAIIGFSGLGMEMAQYAIRHPERVSRLVQVGAVPPAKAIMDRQGDSRGERVDAEAMADLNARINAGEFEDAPELLCRLYNELTLPSNFADPKLADRVPDVCVWENEWPRNLWPYFGRLLGSFGDWDLTAELAALEVPRLVIHGREDGIPLAGAEAWAAHGDARLLLLSPAGHFPFIERPEVFFPAVNAFLNGHWPAGARSLTVEED